MTTSIRNFRKKGKKSKNKFRVHKKNMFDYIKSIN